MKNKFLLKVVLISILAIVFILGAVDSTNTRSTPAYMQTIGESRNRAATAVQAMFEFADRNRNGLGEQVRIIAQNQNQVREKIYLSLNKIQNRKKLVKLLIGPDYKELNNARKFLDESIEQVTSFWILINYNQEDVRDLDNPYRLLEEANKQIFYELNYEGRASSLFGWLFKIFNK